MRYRQVYTPTDYTTITPDMVRRWMALEQRLDLLIEAHGKATPQGDLANKIQDVLMSTLQFIKDGKE